MSTSYYWRPTEAGKYIPDGPNFREVMAAAFGTVSGEYAEGDVATLRGLARASGKKHYDQLADAIEKHGRITIEARS